MEDAEFSQLVSNVLQHHRGNRITPFEYHGKKYWLKQAEKLEGAMRFMKSDPKEALQREIAALKLLGDKQAPVPRLVDAGNDYLVLEDAGITLNRWLTVEGQPSLQSILNDAAGALAGLHKLQLAHGRPALRDIGWQQGKVTFIDFEASQLGKDLLRQQTRDLLVFVHSLYRYLGPRREMIIEAIGQYCRNGCHHVWLAAQKRLKKWQWLRPFLKPLRHRGGRDLRPVYWVLDHFKHTPGCA
ncbi:BUD32 family EKC/KEOPS complex subunit [Shewanella cyperi]|uniref:phosphotransferase n=1 Tax=Shewanella cyperi TaxID=2814292 RepID=UPI001A94FE4B|nr:phosphotransferase [Shewanella cyperi]QSX42121.1 phosphotransferase [Shewanella cyperi]